MVQYRIYPSVGVHSECSLVRVVSCLMWTDFGLCASLSPDSCVAELPGRVCVQLLRSSY